MQSFDYQRMQIFIQSLLEKDRILVQNSEILLYSECTSAPWKFLGGVRESHLVRAASAASHVPSWAVCSWVLSFGPLFSASWWVCAGEDLHLYIGSLLWVITHLVPSEQVYADLFYCFRLTCNSTSQQHCRFHYNELNFSANKSWMYLPYCSSFECK